MMHRINEEKSLNIRKSFWRVTWVLSLLVGIILPLSYEWHFDKREVEIDLPENWRRMSKPEKISTLEKGLSKHTPFFLLAEIQQFNMRKQLIKMIGDKKDGIVRDGFRYRLRFRYGMGWKELALLGCYGFAAVWMIYGCVKILPLFIPSTPIIHFPSQPLSRRVESLHFPIGGKSSDLPYIKITLFSFLVFEERPQKPEKPRAVWVE